MFFFIEITETSVIFQSQRCGAHVAGQIEANRKVATLAVVLIDDGQDVQINQ